jgi:hypothetical protein
LLRDAEGSVGQFLGKDRKFMSGSSILIVGGALFLALFSG